MKQTTPRAGARAARQTFPLPALALLALALLPGAARAQWTQPDASGNTNYPNGNVGIGTGAVAPAGRLDVTGPDATLARFVSSDANTALWIQQNVFGASNMVINATRASNGPFVSLSLAGQDGVRFYSNGSERVRVDAAGNVGIGTNAPDKRLVVIDGAALYLKFLNSDKTGLYMYSNGDYNGINAANFTEGISNPYRPLTLGWGGQNVYIARTGGRVAVGTDAPADQLHVANSSALGAIRVSGVGAGVVNFVDAAAGADAKMYQWKSSGGRFSLGLVNDAGSGYARENILVANAAGNVGIGTAGPQALLHLASLSASLRLEDNGANSLGTTNLTGRSFSLSNRDTGTVSGDVFAVDVARVYGGTSGYAIARFSGGGFSRLLVRGDGYVGVGTDSPAFKLDVRGGRVNAEEGLCIAGVCKGSWEEVGGGGAAGPWAKTGTSAYYNSGNVGIGTAEPDKRLVVMDGVDLYLKFLRSNNKGLYLYSNGDYNGINAADFSNGAFMPLSVGWGADVYLARDGGRVGVGTTNVSHTLEVNGTINASQGITGATISATFQDVAEWVPSVQKLQAGTVVVLDPDRVNQVVSSTESYDTRVAGVVSERPGIALGEGGEGKLLVATTGRVKVKVDASKAPVRIGDLLVTGELPGVAMKSEPVLFGGRKMHAPGTIIGKALEPLAGGVGEILVLLSLQ